MVNPHPTKGLWVPLWYSRQVPQVRVVSLFYSLSSEYEATIICGSALLTCALSRLLVQSQ